LLIIILLYNFIVDKYLFVLQFFNIYLSKYTNFVTYTMHKLMFNKLSDLTILNLKLSKNQLNQKI